MISVGEVGLKTAENSVFLPDCSDKNNQLLSLSITMYYLINPSTLFLAKNILFHNKLNQPKLRFEISGYWKPCESVMAASEDALISYGGGS